jgi:hypothetical protein
MTGKYFLYLEAMMNDRGILCSIVVASIYDEYRILLDPVKIDITSNSNDYIIVKYTIDVKEKATEKTY